MPRDIRLHGRASNRLLLVLCLLFAAVTCRRDCAAEVAADDSNQVKAGSTIAWPHCAIDLDGRPLRLGDSRGCKAVVVVFLGTQCPISNKCIPRLNKLREDYGQLGAEFYGVICDRSVTRKAALEHREKYHLQFPVILDTSGELQKELQPTHVPEAFVLNQDGGVVYRGAIDDEFASLGRKSLEARHMYVRDTVAAAVMGRPIDISQTKPVGCLIEQSRETTTSDDVTYSRHIAPILMAKCANCHRPGEVGPFALLTYDDAASHAQQIALVTAKRIMPPWKAKPGVGHFRNERRLDESEIGLIDTWAKNGTPRGNSDDLPAAPKFVVGWQLGEPDLVIEMPEEFEVPADGPDIYQHFVVPSNLGQTQLVSAFEFRPSNPAVVHHAFVYFDTKGAARRLDEADPGLGYARFGGPGFLADGGLGGWGPGGFPRKLPDDVGRVMWKGADVVLQIHYRPSGKVERDRSKVGIYFNRRSVKKYATDILVANVDLHIPAGAARHRHTASYTLPVDTTLLDITPHMHVLGREMTVTATLPDKKVVSLIRVEDWDFNWQDHYVYAEPVRLPKGTRIDYEAYYDNSSANPQNPHSPPQDVHWGEMSADEMGICYFQATADNFQDFLTLVEHSQAEFETQLQRFVAQQKERYQIAPGASTKKSSLNVLGN